MQKYGQHFLIDQNVINQIIDAALLLRAENLVEIGPGKGALTQQFIARGQKHFTVVEIDPDAFIVVQEAHQVLGEGFARYSRDAL